MIRIRLPYSKIVSLLFTAAFLTMLHQDILKPAGATIWMNYRSLVDDVIEVETFVFGVPAFIQDRQSWEDFCSVGRFKRGEMFLTGKQLKAMHNLGIDPGRWNAGTLNQACSEYQDYKFQKFQKSIMNEETIPGTIQRTLPSTRE